jgi:hypothetical protein
MGKNHKQGKMNQKKNTHIDKQTTNVDIQKSKKKSYGGMVC